jgi:phenylacetate-CoA ligase
MYMRSLILGRSGIHYGTELAGCKAGPMSGGQAEKQAQLIGDFDWSIIPVTSSHTLNLTGIAAFFEKHRTTWAVRH